MAHTSSGKKGSKYCSCLPVSNLLCGCFNSKTTPPNGAAGTSGHSVFPHDVAAGVSCPVNEQLNPPHGHDVSVPHTQQVTPPIVSLPSEQLVGVNPPAVHVVKNYHVFISHRGPDSKKTLVDVLHELFISKGYTCFVDYEGIEPADGSWASIESAIHHSEVQVIVLSPRFAQSAWCLKEVQEIMQLPSRKVLPVFYGVEPSYVPSIATKLTGSEAKAFLELSDISGIRDDQENGFEGRLASHIVSRVAQLVRNPPLYVDPILVDRYRIQANEAEKHLHELLESSRPVVSLGIAGVPHVGKSTIAKLLFNKFHNQFQACSILLDVREKAKSSGGLAELQGKLLKDLVKEDRKIHHTVEGLGLLLERLENIKCFIVIDDIDMEKDQLRNLLVLDKDRLGRGSCLVLTSRYQKIFGWASVDETLTLTNSEEEQLVISYVGEEVYQGFIDHLKESLSMLGLSVSVQKGTLIATLHTKLLLVVLSNSFLASPRLLDELNKVPKSMIVPIFYGLKSHVEGALEPSWLQREALHYSIDLDKPTLLNRAHFKTLISGVLNHLERKYTEVDVAKYPVGLIERQQQLVEKLISNISDSRVKCVGVVGMGGVGKTTLVKALYNNIHNKFEGSVLLLNVRADAAQAGLQHLQKEIIKRVVGIQVDIPSVDEGKRLLSSRLAGTNTLIILDDVDDESQLHALFTPLALGQGSRVIITSRNHEILKAAEVEETYEVQLLSRSDAEMLFWWHAFLRPYPPTEVQHLAQQVIDACQGLPLSLEITGAHMYFHSSDVEFWKETLLHLKNAHNNIFAKLRISVDALDSQERAAFLDVACFLIGKQQETAVRLWKGCGWTAHHHLQVLKNKCLLKVDSINGIIGMHDQVRDLGRYIVAHKSPPDNEEKPPHTRSHIWDEKDARKILQARSFIHGGMHDIRGLRWSSQMECNADAFRGLCDLKLLLLNKVAVNGDFRNFCSEIRWLEWHHCNLDILPPGFCLRELRVLDLSESHHLKALWRRSEHSDLEDEEVPQELLELNLSGCKVLEELPQFDPYLLRLQWLNLSGCCELRELHNSIGFSTSLELLDLTGCENLQFLPDEIKDLKSLRKLLLHGCKSIQSLPERIGQLDNLTEISLNQTKLRTLPDSFGELESLERLDLSNCSELVSLPLSVEGLAMLKFCYMSDCPMLQQLPDGFCNLTKLCELKLANCNLHSLPANFGNLSNLESLWLHGNSHLTSVPSSIGKLCSLKTLNLGSCLLTNEGMPDEIGELKKLGELYLQHTALCQIPASFANFASVSELHIHHCSQLREAAFFPRKLRSLDLGHCSCLQTISGLDALKELESLVLCDCCELQELKGLEGLERLQSLNISGCSSLRSTPGLEAMRSLEKLHLNGSRFIPPTNLFEMPSLENISLFGSEMPICFRNCMDVEIDHMEHANKVIMTVQIPMDMSGSGHVILLCLVSHDQGWSDDSDDYGSYIKSPTFVEGSLVRNSSQVAVGLLYRNRHADCRDQVNIIVLRPDCPLLRKAKVQDKLEIRARSLYQAWTITVKQASYKVVNVDTELKAVLQKISAELRWGALHSFASASVILGSHNEYYSMRGLAAMDIAGNSELIRVRPSNTRHDLQVEKLDLVWRANLPIHSRVRILSHWWPSEAEEEVPDVLNCINCYRCRIPCSYLGQMRYTGRALVGPAAGFIGGLFIPIGIVTAPTGQRVIVGNKVPTDACSHLQVMTKKRTNHAPVIFQFLGLDLRLVSRSRGQLYHTQLYSHSIQTGQ